MQIARLGALLFQMSLIFSLQAFGQVDPSSSLLLSSSTTSTGFAGIESGRYQVKKSDKTSEKEAKKESKPGSLPKKKVKNSNQNSNLVEEQLEHSTAVVVTEPPTTTTLPRPSARADSKSKTASQNSSTEMERTLFSKPSPVPQQSQVKEETKKPEPKAEIKPEPKALAEAAVPTIGEQVQDLLMGREQPTIEIYKEQIHPDDIRMNMVEISVLLGLISNSSKSNYSYRNYNSSAPKILLGAQFWLTPFMGIYGDYSTSMGGDVAGDPATRSRVLAQHEWTEAGIDVRKYFGMSRRSNSISYGVQFLEYKFSVPGDELNRLKIKSTGFGLHLVSRIPVAPSYAWILGGKFIPRIRHMEMDTGLSASSGSSGESNRLDVIIGGEFKMSRQNQIVWDLTTSFEKNQFGGQATTADPETGLKPKGVTVENTFFLLSFGYRWGQ